MKQKKFYRHINFIDYNPQLVDYSNEMRNASTKGEIKFWCELLRGRKTGYQFYRQRVILNYIVDFYCPKLKLVVEIDGTSHDNKKEYDIDREIKLNRHGLKIIRYSDINVLDSFLAVEKDFAEKLKIRAEEIMLMKEKKCSTSE